MPRRGRVALVANTSWYLYNFRPTLMNALQYEGYEVVAVAPQDAYSGKLVEAGYCYRHVPLNQRSINPIGALQSILYLRRVLRDEKVDAVLSFTPKGNIFSGFAIADRSVTFIANMSGLGRAFSRGPWLLWAAMTALKWSLLRANTVLFQNNEDLKLLVEEGVIAPAKAKRIPGSGVDLQKFSWLEGESARRSDDLIFLFVGRLLWEKGIGEYVNAARSLKNRYPHMKFRILGPVQPGPVGVSQRTIDIWQTEGLVEYLGVMDDVRAAITEADCIVLPSYYREGVPRSLLEAAALKKPVITTDLAGCREAVADGSTGFLCTPRDVEGLIAALERFIMLSVHEREEMGRRGRAKMESEFDETLVIDQYLGLVSGAFS